ncbi:MAG TPA: MerR family transcriptional regulator [Bacillota bacterium]|nr:MerR family transcriptional regulator [Bacillota bacterium]
MKSRPVDIARKLNISASALRHYENWGMVPPVERAANGYRIYTEEHIAYFECIRAMAPGFGIQVTAEVLKKIQKGEVDEALWIINLAQTTLRNEKVIAEKTIQSLGLVSQKLVKHKLNSKRDWLTIHEVSEATAIPTTTIRHWEKTGLFTTSRNEGNRYRKFNSSHVRQILIIHALKAPLYSANYSLDGIKQIVRELNDDNLEQIRQIALDFQKHLNQINQHQLRGAHYLYRLCVMLNLVDEGFQKPWA